MLERGFEGRCNKGGDGVWAWRKWLAPELTMLMLVLSGVLNGLQLLSSLLVLHLYDQVLPSQNLAGLGTLMGLMMVLHAGFALLDLVRARVLGRAGLAFVEDLDRRVLDALKADGARAELEALGDVERVGRFLINAGPAALFDLVWLPACLIVLSLFSPALGLYAGAGVVLLGGLAIAAEVESRGALQESADRERRRLTLLSTTHDADRRQVLSRALYRARAEVAERALAVGAVAKGLRLMLLSGGLGLGALLVIKGVLSPGGLVASSVILGRTVASLDSALVHWRSLVVARASYMRLLSVLSAARSGPHPVRARLAITSGL